MAATIIVIVVAFTRARSAAMGLPAGANDGKRHPSDIGG
jgi:hypothetical protein